MPCKLPDTGVLEGVLWQQGEDEVGRKLSSFSRVCESEKEYTEETVVLARPRTKAAIAGLERPC